MKALEILFPSFFLFFFLRPAGACLNHCSSNAQEVRFPFQIINGSSTGRCGYRGFGLTCNNDGQTVLKLPSAGDFIVRSINYSRKRIWIGDPDGCMPKRLLNFSLSGSPFEQARQMNFTLLSCSMDHSSTDLLKRYAYKFWSETCVNETNHAIVAVESTNMEFAEDLLRQCREIKNVSVSPNRNNFRPDLWGSLELKWDEPNCRACERDGGTCRFKGDTGLDIGCSKASSQGIPRSAKYGLIIGVGIPGLLCLIGLSCFTCGWIRTCVQRRQLSDAEFSIAVGLQPTVIVTGLDGPTIESYPKTVLGESRRLPEPNDSTCPICLSEYQPKDTIRTIPECNHCFHANCVDEWLKMNATCPLCRNSPDGSSLVTPCSSVSSSTTLSPSSS